MKKDTICCAECPFPKLKKFCVSEKGKGLPNCPTAAGADFGEETKALLEESGDLDFFLVSSNFGGKKITRVMETIEFSHAMGYRKIGMAFCSSLVKEAKLISALFEAHGLEVVSAICKVGRIKIDDVAQEGAEKCTAKGLLCNPVKQAQIMNEAKTDYNVVVGLCVGHDSLFMKYAEAMSTVLVAKDRVLGHNPLAAIWTLDSFYTHIKTPKADKG